jgi:hypothetical protein
MWGASRIHGELLKLGYEVAQSTISEYMARGDRPPSQNWKTFLRNHAEAIRYVPHLALNKDCPLKRPIQHLGSVAAIPVHHQYVRI